MTGRLKVAEETFEDPPPTMQHDDKLYLTEEEWDARRSRRELEKSSPAGSGGSGGCGGGGKRGRGHNNGGEGRGSRPKSTDECRRCGKLGHWARDCRSKPRKEQAHVTQEEEAALNLMRASLAHSGGVYLKPARQESVRALSSVGQEEPRRDAPISAPAKGKLTAAAMSWQLGSKGDTGSLAGSVVPSLSNEI
ncbi:hypothetical protein GUJ93_ZPchr0002g25296 [Zizania palustris]|uniref:CCHC-type domain-containing protein n=1 Tax=Zizania palustris TaxID=103762 RepID=A0A8J5VC65_ZIZPA|nr:hypothetical protein GUJ93_ZPchr0002g25296 [Zizania palustris]